MKRSIKIVTSVVLTAGIVAGAAAYGKHEFSKPDRRAEFMVSYIADELDLNATQEQALDTLKDEVLAARKLMHEQMSPTKEELVALITAERFDQARALDIISSKTATLNQAAPAVVAAFGNFLDGLDAEQKGQIQKLKESRGHHHNHGNDYE